ncbi:hypothetical protein [Methanoculleus chikugoensis]|uniref:hypothetical protein n=1 Tax=Methanoculleus chikugoensis TaxID=118126 RepID=UPI000ABED441|nr:hypothetical protein [Methanoculleus chikugoensis]
MITADEDATLTDSEAIWLIFRSGGMTTSRIITDLSGGGGLGLAIVEDTVSRLGGER